MSEGLAGGAGVEWTVERWYENKDGDRVLLASDPARQVWTVTYAYARPHLPQVLQYERIGAAFTAFGRSIARERQAGTLTFDSQDR